MGIFILLKSCLREYIQYHSHIQGQIAKFYSYIFQTLSVSLQKFSLAPFGGEGRGEGPRGGAVAEISERSANLLERTRLVRYPLTLALSPGGGEGKSFIF